MKLVDFICFEASIPEFEAKERNAIINEMLSALDKAGKLGKDNAEKIARAVIRRENEASTGLGKGVAVPHIKHASVKKPVAAVGLSSCGIDFNSLDKQPVYSVFLLVSPTKNEEDHLQAMECMFSHLQKDKFRNFLRQSDSVEKIEDLLREADDNPEL